MFFLCQLPKAAESPKKHETNPASPIISSQPPAVLATESVHINIKDLPSTNQTSSHVQKPTTFSSPAVIEVPTTNVTSFSTPTPNEQGLRTIELSSGRVREGFGKPKIIYYFVCFNVHFDPKCFHLLANGDVIVTLLPINTRWPWIVPPVFRPELVPEELMAQGLTVQFVINFLHI